MKIKDVMQRSVTTVAEDESLGLALQLMLWNEVRHVPVLRPADGRVTGVISERDILRAHYAGAESNALKRPVREFMTSPAVHIHPNAELADAAAEFATKSIGCLPVIEAGELLGIVTTTDLATTVAQCSVEGREAEGGGQDMVSALMQPNPFVARADEPLMLAAGRMLRGGFRHLCIVDQDEKLVGMLSDRDVRNAVGDPLLTLRAASLPLRLAKLTIGQAMTPQPYTLKRDDSIKLAIDALLTHRLGALPVVDAASRPVGVVSYVDILRHVADRAA